MLAAGKQSRWASYTLRNAQEGAVEFDLAVVCHNTQGKRGRHQRKTLLYATWGVRHRSLSWVRTTYRSRFGIETSYRQLHQARIRTSSRNPALRLLFVAVALILRNIWVWLHAEVMVQPQAVASRVVALEPSAVVVDGGGRKAFTTLSKCDRLSRFTRKGTGFWFHFQLLSLFSENQKC